MERYVLIYKLINKEGRGGEGPVTTTKNYKQVYSSRDYLLKKYRNLNGRQNFEHDSL